MAKKRYIKHSRSKNPLRNFSLNNTDGTIFPDFSMDALYKLVNDDPVARGALNHFIDKCVEGPFFVVDKETRKLSRSEMSKLETKYSFRHRILRTLFFMGKMYRNAFVEIVRDSEGRVKDLNVLDTPLIKPVTQTNGDVLHYISRQEDPVTGKKPQWDKNDIVWYKFGDISQGYAPVDLKALYEVILTKKYIQKFVAWLWKSGQYRFIYNFGSGTTDTDIENWLAFNRVANEDFSKPFIAKGDFQGKVLRDMQESESLVELLKYYDSQILILMRVSPVDAGIPDASGRSNSEALSNSFATSVQSIRRAVQDVSNYSLFPKLSKSKWMLVAGPVDRFNIKASLETAQVMNSMGISNDAVEEFLGDCGLYWENKLFDEVKQEGVSNPRDKDNMPSRVGKGVGEKSQSIGTGEQGTTREDQLKK